MFSPVALVAPLLAASGVAILAVFGSCQTSPQKPFELTDLTSPDATYRATFRERIGFPRPTRHEIQFDVFKGETRILKDEQFYEGGVYDDSFSTLYPDHRWISPSILRFGRIDNSPEPQHDEVAVENATDRTLTSLRVNVGKYEAFLLLEIKPKSVLTLKVQAQTDEGQDVSYIGCKGRFEDTSLIREAAGNFRIRGEYHGPAHYTVKVLGNSVLITSKEFESLPPGPDN